MEWCTIWIQCFWSRSWNEDNTTTNNAKWYYFGGAHNNCVCSDICIRTNFTEYTHIRGFFDDYFWSSTSMYIHQTMLKSAVWANFAKRSDIRIVDISIIWNVCECTNCRIVDISIIWNVCECINRAVSFNCCNSNISRIFYLKRWINMSLGINLCLCLMKIRNKWMNGINEITLNFE